MKSQNELDIECNKRAYEARTKAIIKEFAEATGITIKKATDLFIENIKRHEHLSLTEFLNKYNYGKEKTVK